MRYCSVAKCTNKASRTGKCYYHNQNDNLDIPCSYGDCSLFARYITEKLCNKHYHTVHKKTVPIADRKRLDIGQTKTSEYRNWQHMIQRCTNSNDISYKNYGARGIEVCDRWQGKYGFINLLEDIGPKPDKGYSISRIDNDGNYEPGNVEWATAHQQAGNKRNSNKHVGITYTKLQVVNHWEAYLKINKVTVFRERFFTEEEAIQAREEAEIKYLGGILKKDKQTET